MALSISVAHAFRRNVLATDRGNWLDRLYRALTRRLRCGEENEQHGTKYPNHEISFPCEREYQPESGE
jgi:hypothetical protein